METTRQNKIARLLQKELSDIFLLQTKSMPGILISVSAVRISPDMSVARAYLSVFPSERSEEIIKNVNANMKSIRFELGTRVRHQLRIIPELKFFVDDSLEENAMVQYKDRQAMAVIKGVEDNFEQLTSIDSLLYGTGKFILNDSVVDYGFMGVELVSELGTGLQFVDPLRVYAPKRNVRVNIANPSAAFNQDYLFSPGAVFVVNQQKYDSRYILTSLGFARRLFNYDTEVSAIELKLKPGSNTDAVQKKMERILGDRFIVQNRYEQQADVFRIMEIEKLISYLFLTFILTIACFNVIGSLSMLILDKREDTETLRNLGADDRLIARIFLFEGRLISVFGAIAGIVLGLLLCFLQQRFGLISLGGGNGSFVVDAYPVSVHATDIILVFVTVITVGFLSVWYPVRYLSKRLLKK